jgi:5-methylcytosine-specific restriction enzyme A
MALNPPGYVLVHDGKSYDSKAIVGAAHGHLPGEAPLLARQFSGGEATVVGEHVIPQL